MGTKNNPGKFDCYANADPDEPMFVLLGRDPAAPLLINLWADIRARMGEDQEKIDEADDCEDACLVWLEMKDKELEYRRVLQVFETIIVEMRSDEIKRLRSALEEVAQLKEGYVCDPAAAAIAEAGVLRSLVRDLTKQLIWCSGSDDFQEGGKACEGWRKGPATVIERARKIVR